MPIVIGRKTVHFLVSHPTPPVFDGPEDRNGTRNHDEIRFWADYIRRGRRSRYTYDDAGRRGGLEGGAVQRSGVRAGGRLPVPKLRSSPRLDRPGGRSRKPPDLLSASLL